MTPLELVEPAGQYRVSYSSLVTELVESGEQFIPFTLGFEHNDFDALLARLRDCAQGIGLPQGFVAHSNYWLVRDGSEVVGVANIRLALTPALRREGGNIGYGIRPSARGCGMGNEILRLALMRARTLGLWEVLLTCGKDNAVSAKVIVRHGGVLESEEFLPDRGEIVQRYWIKVD
ncbi:MAG: GNAT family N-acetyltransferase [Betaproteobacteria bacterium]